MHDLRKNAVGPASSSYCLPLQTSAVQLLVQQAGAELLHKKINNSKDLKMKSKEQGVHNFTEALAG